ncbi:MAG: cation transporter, partial [Bauldia sp.]
MKAGGPTGVILVALATNLGLAAAKLAAAAVTGSSAMLATAIQTLAGAGNQMLMLLGFQRARQPPDAVHPFGYARE